MNRALAVVAASIILPGAPASGGDPASAEARIAALTRQVAALEDRRIDDDRAAEIETLVRDVLADADARASLRPAGPNAGHDGHFFVESADDRFRLEIRGQIRYRYVYNRQDDASSGNTDDGGRGGFDVRKARIELRGHVVDPTWRYAVQGSFSRTGGAMRFDNVWIGKDLGDGWSVRVGSFRPPSLREGRVSALRQLAVERSLVHGRFGTERSAGLEVAYASDRTRFAAVLHEGSGNNRTPALDRTTEYAASVRLEYAAVGELRRFRDFTSRPGSDDGLLIGAAVLVQAGESGTADDEVEELLLTADASWESDGWNAMVSATWQHLDDDAGSDTSPWGLVVQAGAYVTDDLEAFARWEYGDDDAGGLARLNVVTVGVSRFFRGHDVRWTTDVGYGLDAVQGAWGDQGSAGWRPDLAGDDGQLVIRSQVQIVF